MVGRSGRSIRPKARPMNALTDSQKKQIRVLLKANAEIHARKARRRLVADARHWCGGSMERVGHREIRCVECGRIRFDK